MSDFLFRIVLKPLYQNSSFFITRHRNTKTNKSLGIRLFPVRNSVNPAFIGHCFNPANKAVLDANAGSEVSMREDTYPVTERYGTERVQAFNGSDYFLTLFVPD
jgi:hypothetical protein